MIFVTQAAATGVLHDLVLDVAQYEAFARHVLNGELTHPDLGYMNPLYSFFLALVWAVAGESRTAVGVVQAVLDSLTVLWIFMLGARLFDRRVALLAAATYAAYGPAIFYSGLLLAATLVCFLLTTSLMLWLRAVDRDARVLLVASGVLFGLAALGRPNLVLVLPVVPLLHALLWPPGVVSARRLRWLVLFGVGLLLPLGASSVRNLAASGSPSPFSTNGGINFYMGNGPGATGVFRAPDEVSDSPLEVVTTSVAVASKQAGKPLTSRQASRYWFRQGLRHMANHPGDTVALYLRKVGLFWGRDEVPLNVDYAGGRTMVPLMRLPFVGFGLVAPLAVVGFTLLFAGRREGWLAPLLVLSYSGSVVLFFVAGRFRFPVVPWIVIGASYAAFAVIDMATRRRVGAALAAGSAVLVLLVAINLGAGSPDVSREAIHHHNLGNAYLDQGRRDLAERSYRWALEALPSHTNAMVNLGTMLFEDGRLDEALELFERARSLAPRVAEVTLNIGNVHHARGNLDDASREYERAIELDPSLVEARYNLGRVLYDLGRPDSARKQFERTLELDPDFAEAHYMLGGIALAQQRFEDAVAAFDATCHLQPDHPQARLYLCLGLVNAGRFDRAREQCRLARQQGHAVPDRVWQILGSP
jgi:tetratricopeptide (TPR) repeat protein